LPDADDDRLGAPLPGWSGATSPAGTELAGRFVTLESLDAQRHGAALFAALHDARDARVWDYLPRGPFAGQGPVWDEWIVACAGSADPLFYALTDPATGVAHGMGSYLRIEPDHGVIEIGHLAFGPQIQRTPATTEAIYLLARHAFDELGNRRLEWKCNALNARSRAAALRFGFAFEGVFRQSMVVKGRSRDTAWYAIVDGDWPVVRAAFETWLAPENFDANGRQRRTLAELRGVEPAPTG
jgi:RimJ/RimL family protein N-acetyltransferase